SCLVLLVSPLFLSGDGFVLHFFLFFFFPLARSIFYSLSLHDALPIYFNFYIFYVLFIHLWKMQIIQLKFKSIIKMTICSIIFCFQSISHHGDEISVYAFLFISLIFKIVRYAIFFSDILIILFSILFFIAIISIDFFQRFGIF